MKIDILTIFPDAVRGYFDTSIMRRAQAEGQLTLGVHDIRTYSTGKHHNVDDTPYGGGAGMVMQVEPIHKAVEDVRDETLHSRVILMSAKGATYVQSDAVRLGEYEQIILICGRYEGVDERVAQYIADEEIAIGEYVLTGGELGAMVVSDSIVRLLPEVLGNDLSAVHESHAQPGYREHPPFYQA